MPDMRSNPLRLVILVVVIVVALAGVLMLFKQSSPDNSGSNGGGTRGSASDIWKVGDRWTAQVRQDGGAISPDAAKSVTKVPFRFEVTKAPSASNDAWTIKVTQDGAEGPFAAGWRLYYVETDGEMVLSKVATGAATDKPLEAELATIVLGSQFPYEVRYAAPPKDASITAADLIERSSLPPTSSVPGSDAKDGPKGAPTAPPIDQAIAPGTAPATPKR
ncbi:MAG: hypothetical protein JWL76_659 [Thermoleophilia bacterium]|nr:hypothetical protein [Thermoleophilia bacterium]